MKQFINLEIKANENDLITLLDELKQTESKMFSFDSRRTKDYAINLSVDTNKVAFFKANYKKHYNSSISLAIIQSKLYVTNIISSSISFLGIEKYNEVLKDFWKNFFEPIVDTQTYTVKITKEVETIEELLCPAVCTALKQWESCCNKSAPTSHPLDRERWFKFLTLSVDNNNFLSVGIFEKWLIEDKEWCCGEYSKVEELVLEYEYGQDLLKYYKDNQFE